MGKAKTKKHQVAIWVTDETDLVKAIARPENWLRIGKSTTNTVTANPTTNTYDYIDQEQAETELEKYSYSMEHDIAAYKGNKDYEWAWEKFYYADTGDNSKGLVLVVFMDHEETAGVYKAFIAPATFSISSADWVSGVVNVSIAFNDTPKTGSVSGSGQPTFSLAPEKPSIVVANNTVTIASETDGATIKYTLDGSNPIANGSTYSEGITITEDCTVKAVAIKGSAYSRIVKAECEYTE